MRHEGAKILFIAVKCLDVARSDVASAGSKHIVLARRGLKQQTQGVAEEKQCDSTDTGCG
jgi:hypothetical protein